MAEATCSINGCNRKVQARGWCAAHYARNRKHGDPLAGGSSPRTRCDVTGCERRHHANGYCTYHEKRRRLFGDPVNAPTRRKPAPTCSIEGCERPDGSSKGWCRMHYWRWRRHGDPAITLKEKGAAPVDGLCSELGCSRQHFGRGMCMTHYTRWRRAQPWYVPRPEVKRAEIFERDHWICHLCGDPINPDARHPDPLTGSIDHVVPRSLGGPDEPSNLAASHLVCNMRKGNRVQSLPVNSTNV